MEEMTTPEEETPKGNNIDIQFQYSRKLNGGKVKVFAFSFKDGHLKHYKKASNVVNQDNLLGGELAEEKVVEGEVNGGGIVGFIDDTTLILYEFKRYTEDQRKI